MTANDTKSAIVRLAACRVRRLVFDTLEDRRMMAGLDVFVFDDLDGSRTFDSVTDGAVITRAVYIDLNNDAKFSSNEPLAVSNDQGIASFADLSPGEYAVRLLGSNKSVVQTFPTRPADQGTWVDGFSFSKVVAVTGSGMAWGISSNTLSLINPNLSQTVKSIRFGSAIVVDAVLKPNADGEMTGYVLTEELDNRQVLWQVSTSGNGTKRALNAEISNATQLVNLDSVVFVVHGTNTKEISKFDFATGSSGVNLTSTGITGLPADVVVKSSAHGGLLVLSDGASADTSPQAVNPSVLSLYQINDGVGRLVGSRAFSTEVFSWDIAKDGSSIAVGTVDGVSILRPELGLPTRTTLAGATSPILFEPVKGLLITGDADDASRLVGWQPSDLQHVFSIPISKSRAISAETAWIDIDESGSQIVLTQDGAIYQHNIAAPEAAMVQLLDNEQKKVVIGVKTTASNIKPTLGSLGSVQVDEDSRLNFDSRLLQSAVSDLDGDNIVFVVRSGPTNGRLTWNESGSGFYLPAANWNGQDEITIQAYDGRDWSSIQVLPIEVQAMNDLPSDIEFTDALVAENSPIATAFGTFKVLDADTDAQYDFVTSDDRFGVVDGTVRLVRGSVDFEEEPIIVLAVTAIDRMRVQDRITRTFAMRIQNANDAPNGISAPSSLSVPELVENMEIAKLTVIDQDSNDTYEWSVSDSRFTVDDGVLRLTISESLDYETEPIVHLIVRAVESRSGFSVERPLTIQVTDQDDEPSRIVITSSGRITENETGAVVGQVNVIDADQGEQYAFSVSDSRFEVTAGGTLRLRLGASVSYTAPGIIDLTVFATSLRTSTRISGSLRLFVQKDPTPYHNDLNPYDVDGDGTLTPLDPLIIINHINDNGIGPIEAPGEGEGPLPDLDVDGDGVVSPIDILILINKLNQQIEENTHSMGDFGEGEGSLANVSRSSSNSQAAVLPTVGAATRSSSGVNDVSLASYLADLSDDLINKKSKRS